MAAMERHATGLTAWWRALPLLLVLAALPTCRADIMRSSIREDNRYIINFEKFGFDKSGSVELHVNNPSVLPNNESVYKSMGFLLTSAEAWTQVVVDEAQHPEHCPLDNRHVLRLFRLDDVFRSADKNFSFTMTVPDANEYTLVFANCEHYSYYVSMDVKTVMFNLVGKNRNYLPLGQTQLPSIYLAFGCIYLILAGVWVYICLKQKETAHLLHALMGLLIFIKASNLLFEAADMANVQKTGEPHGWDIAFSISGLFRGVMLFIVIVLIGTGWSFLKPYLQDKEKKVLMVVIPLQVFANIASIVSEETGQASNRSWMTWRQVFILLDIICCIAVLVPIVWSIKHLREASQTDGKAARNIIKLTLFRQYYIVVVSYIYFTRIVVFALKTVTTYQYMWTSDVAEEAATLAFYIFTGYKFRPVAQNPYFVLDDEEEEAAREALKDEDFDL